MLREPFPSSLLHPDRVCVLSFFRFAGLLVRGRARPRRQHLGLAVPRLRRARPPDRPQVPLALQLVRVRVRLRGPLLRPGRRLRVERDALRAQVLPGVGQGLRHGALLREQRRRKAEGRLRVQRQAGR